MVLLERISKMIRGARMIKARHVARLHYKLFCTKRRYFLQREAGKIVRYSPLTDRRRKRNSLDTRFERIYRMPRAFLRKGVDERDVR